MTMNEVNIEHNYVDNWVESTADIMESVGIDEGTEIVATGMPRAGHLSYKGNEACSADRLLQNVFFQHGEEADVKAYRERDEFNVERAQGEPQWKFPSARSGRNENLVVVEGPEPSVIKSVTRNPDVHLFADAASYTGHEIGMEDRKSSEAYGRTDEVLSEDFGADVGIATVKHFPFFCDTASDRRDEADFEEYVTEVEEQVDSLYESTEIFGLDIGASEVSPDQDPGMVYILGEGRK